MANDVQFCPWWARLRSVCMNKASTVHEGELLHSSVDYSDVVLLNQVSGALDNWCLSYMTS